MDTEMLAARWPWMLLWGVVLIAVIATVSTAARLITVHRRERKARRRNPGVCFYLDDDAVEYLYVSNTGYRIPLRQEVEEEIRSGKNAKVTAAFAGSGAQAGTTFDEKTLRKYVEMAEPITVIRIIMDVLEDAHDVVYVDLINNHIEANDALNKILRSIPGQGLHNPDPVRLSGHEMFFSVWGRFRGVDQTTDEKEVRFTAPYGKAVEAGRPQVSITGQVAWLRGNDRSTKRLTGAFQARCLGRITDWNDEDLELEIEPIAIFR